MSTKKLQNKTKTKQGLRTNLEKIGYANRNNDDNRTVFVVDFVCCCLTKFSSSEPYRGLGVMAEISDDNNGHLFPNPHS